MHKTYIPNKKGFDFEITLSTQAKDKFNYVLEHNFHFSEYESITINDEQLSDQGTFLNTNTLKIYDAELKQNILITLDKSCDIHYFQLKTLSQSEHGFDLSVQGISFAMVMPFSKDIAIKGTLEVLDV